MRIPYVIDNVETRLADVLNTLLERQTGQQVARHSPSRNHAPA